MRHTLTRPALTASDDVSDTNMTTDTRTRTPISIVVAVALLTAGSAAHAASERVSDKASDPTIRLSPARAQFNLPTQPLEDSLRAVAAQTNSNILFDRKLVQGIQAAPLTAEMSVGDALAELLKETDLTVRNVDDRTVMIVSKTLNTSHQTSLAGLERVSFRSAQDESPGSTDETTSASAGTEESSGAKIEEIVVTAQKREERLKDVPMSIAVVGNQEIERRGVIGMQDYLRSVPGVNQIDRGGADNAIVIRGITTSPQLESIGSGSTVATYFDETPITGAAGMGGGGIDVRPVDIERIEVLRGPQGTAYGSSSLGGTLRMIPAKPKLDAFSAKVAANYSQTEGEGSDNSMIQGVVNIPVVADRFAVRAVGYRYDDSGFYRNTAGIDPATVAWAEGFGLGNYVRGHVQDDVGRMLSTGARLGALWRVTDRLDLSLNFLTQKIEQDGSPTASIGPFEQAVSPMAPQTQARVRRTDGEIADTEMDLANLQLNYDLGWGTLTSVVSWIDSGSLSTNGIEAADGLAPLLGPSSSSSQSDYQAKIAEVRLASQFQGRFQFLGGLYYEDIEEGTVQHTGDWPGAPESAPSRTTPAFIADVTRELDQRAIFGEVSYALTDTLTATAGGRYYEYDKDQSLLFEGGLINVPYGTGATQILGNGANGSTLKANLKYQPTQNALLYASWAEGFRLGRPDTGLSLATGLCDRDGDGIVDGSNISVESTTSINPDTLEQYELGGKFTLFDGRMVVDTAIYHIEWQGLPVRTVAPCGSSYTANVGAAVSDGVEFQASLLVTPGLRLDFGAGFTKAELSKDAPSLLPPAFKGDRLPASPEVNANLAVQYDFELIGHDAFVRADSFYTGEFYGDLSQSPLTKAGEYVKVDARTGILIRNLSLELFVRNLTNQDAYTWRGLSNTAAFSGYQLRPRTFGIQLGYSFE